MKLAENGLSGVGAKTSIGGSKLPSTLDALEEMFVRCHWLWWRSPGVAAWPFAGDGPWHLIQGEVGDVKGDFSTTLIETESGQLLEVRKVESRRPRTPLSTAEVDERDRVTGWLRLAGDDVDARIIWVATRQLDKGEGRVPWKAVRDWLVLSRSPEAVADRYKRALATVLCRVNGWPTNRVRALAREWNWRPVEDRVCY